MMLVNVCVLVSECLGSRPAWPYLHAPRGAWVFRLSSFVSSSSLRLSFLCSCAHRWVPVSFPITCTCRGKLSRCWVLLLFYSYSLCSCSVVVVLWKRLRLSRQAVKLRLLERFNKLGWATTCRCDNLAQWTGFDVMISHGWPAKLPRRCSFFLSVLSFLFSFFFLFYNAFGLVCFSSSKDQCWAEKVIIWIVLLNLHDATRSTRFCNNRESLPAWLSFFLQHVGQYRSKMIMMKNLSRKSFIEAATCTAAKGMITRGKKVSSVEGNEEYMEFFFCYRADCSTEY